MFDLTGYWPDTMQNKVFHCTTVHALIIKQKLRMQFFLFLVCSKKSVVDFEFQVRRTCPVTAQETVQLTIADCPNSTQNANGSTWCSPEQVCWRRKLSHVLNANKLIKYAGHLSSWGLAEQDVLPAVLKEISRKINNVNSAEIPQLSNFPKFSDQQASCIYSISSLSI